MQKLVAETPVAEANYGESVAISDGKIAIGAPNDVSVSYSDETMRTKFSLDLMLLIHFFQLFSADQSFWKCILLLPE